MATELWLGGTVLALLVLGSLAARFIPRHLPNTISSTPFAGPSAQHWLGTDNLGRDTFTRVFIAAGTSLFIAASATALSALAGTALGLVAAYRGGLVDAVIMRACDVLMAIPAILMALIVRVIVGPGIGPLIVAMAIIYTPTFARVMRAPVMALRHRDFVVAAQISGTPAPLIALRHLLPNALTPLMVQAAVTASDAVLLEAGLSYLGQGVQPPDPSIGMMISEFQRYVQTDPLLMVLPALVVVMIAAACNLVADGLQATWSPRADDDFSYLRPRPWYRRFFGILLPADRRDRYGPAVMTGGER